MSINVAEYDESKYGDNDQLTKIILSTTIL